MSFVSIIMGSKSDYATMKNCEEIFKKFSVKYELVISSAHRTPSRTKNYVIDAEKRGAMVFICAAGMAAHLAGSVSALTLKPVIGVPMTGGAMDGLDALLSTVQMPSGMPVATLAIGKAGAQNSAYLAMQILAINDISIYKSLTLQRAEAEEKVQKDSKEIEIL
jgi:5-(carboxyamino)imidazole ribonucleotide mutase